MEPVTQQKNVVIGMVLPMGRALMVMVFVASVSFKKAVNFGLSSFVVSA